MQWDEANLWLGDQQDERRIDNPDLAALREKVTGAVTSEPGNAFNPPADSASFRVGEGWDLRQP